MADKKARRGKTPAKGQTNLKTFYGLIAAVAVVGIAWISYSVANRGGGDTAVAPVPVAGMEDMQTLLREAQGIPNGPAEAGAQVLIFSDFTCPACKQFASIVEPQMRTEFLEPGRARFVYYDFPLGGGTQQHKWGFVAARAARCAGEQDKYWEFHDVLFARQIEWSYQRDVPTKEFNEYAKLVGIQSGEFSACLRSDKFADVVSANRRLGEQLGVSATPTVFIGGRPVGAWNDYSAVRAAILAELGESQPAAPPGQ